MLKEEIKKIVEEKIAGTDCYLVDVKVSPSKVMVFIDKPTAIKIEDCVEISRHLQHQLEESGIWENHELEVSSPGMGEPLKVPQQYQKSIGRQVSIITFDGIKHIGILKAISPGEVELEETRTKKVDGRKEKITQIIHLPFSEIKETKIEFSFEKITR
jgi:ribosome maturation factor RimP